MNDNTKQIFKNFGVGVIKAIVPLLMTMIGALLGNVALGDNNGAVIGTAIGSAIGSKLS